MSVTFKLFLQLTIFGTWECESFFLTLHLILNQLLFIAYFLIILHIFRTVVKDKVRDVGTINMKSM